MSTASLNAYTSPTTASDDLNTLVTRYAPLVKRIAHHLAGRLPASVQIDDLIQAGMMGLLEAIRRFDPSQGAAFETFAEWRIRGTMLDELRRGDWAPRSVHRRAREVTAAIARVESRLGQEARETDIADEMGLSLADYQNVLMDLRGQKVLSLDQTNEAGEDVLSQLESPQPDPLQNALRQNFLESLVSAIDLLPEREKLVLSLYYDEGLNLKEIGAVLRVSESRVSQLHSQALARLRARTRDHWHECNP